MSSAVEKTWDFLTGIVVPFSIILVITPPKVSIPSDKGVTSRRRTSLTSPLKTPPWIAAPAATTSSGLTPLLSSLPPKYLETASCAAGTRVEPPTMIISLISLLSKSASFIAVLIWSIVSSISSEIIPSNLARVSFITKC